MRILLIEDNLSDAKLVKALLKETSVDFTFNVAEELGQGLQFLSNNAVDVVLLDLNLPDSYGLKTLTRLQTQFPHVPVVIMTGFDDEALATQALQLGAQDYLIKGQGDGLLLKRALSYAVERKQINDGLLQARDELEQRVAEQTAEIRQANELLEQRIAERTHELQETNAALRQSRRTALNLIEDAVAARKQTEETNLALRNEIGERERAQEALRQKAERDAALAGISRTISHVGFDLHALLNIVAQRVGETLGEICDVTLLSDDKQWLRPQSLFDRSWMVSQMLDDLFPSVPCRLDEGLVGQVAQTAQPVLLAPITRETMHQAIHPAFVPSVERSGMRGLIIVPISTEGKVLGTLTVARFESQEVYTEDDLSFLQSIANRTALAIVNARLYHQVQDARAVLEQRVIERTESERKQRMLAETLRDASAAFSETLDLNKVSDALLEHLARSVPYDSADVILIDNATQAHVQVARGMASDHTSFDIESLPVLRELYNSGASRLLADVTWRHANPVASSLAVPLKANNVVIGIFSAHKHERAFFTDEHVRLAEALALPAAVSIQNALFYSKLAEAHDQLGTLSRQLLDAQENERREVARELHDEIGQVLTAVRTNLQILRITHDDPLMNRHLDDSMAIVDHAVDEIRALSLNLRPSILDEFGLAAALEWYLERQAERTGLEIDLTVEPEQFRVPAPLETTCFRVIQSAITNVVRHAKATQAQVMVQQSPVEDSQSETACQIEAVISDNGIGFDVQAALERARHGASMGLLGMQERVRLAGGQFKIVSEPGRGTEVHLWLPVV